MKQIGGDNKLSNNMINKQNLLTYLIKELEKENYTEDVLHNEYTYNWMQGYKRGILSTIELINRYIEKEN